MLIYKVYVSMALIIVQLKKFRIGEFNSVNPILFIEADDPDDACYKVYEKLCDIVLKQDASIETAKLLRELQDDFRIVKVELPK